MLNAKTNLFAIASLALTPIPAIARVSNSAGSAASESSFFDSLKLDELIQNNSLSHWGFLLLMIVAGLAAGVIAAFIANAIATRLSHRKWHAQSAFFSSAASPASLTLFTLGLSIGLARISMSASLKDLTGRILLLLYTIALFWYIFNLVAAVEMLLRRFTKRTQTALDDELVPVIRKSLRIFVVVIAVLFTLQNVFDRDIGAWLAGLGIAGLAVSLAAQDSLKNLFGSITILFDRPFAVGQRIKYAGYDGVVTAVGFRSTRVRTFDGTEVTIPNSAIVNDSVENVGARQTIRRIVNVTITYDTPVAKVREAVRIITDLLENSDLSGPVHDPDTSVNANPPRVFFSDLNAENLNIVIYYWYFSLDWWAYMEYSQRFNLRLMEEFEKAGIEFAFPTKTIYLATDPKRKLWLENGNPFVENEGITMQGNHA